MTKQVARINECFLTFCRVNGVLSALSLLAIGILGVHHEDTALEKPQHTQKLELFVISFYLMYVVTFVVLVDVFAV